MSDKNKIKNFIKEAETYFSQGLLEQARQRYLELIDFIRETKELQEKESLYDYINKKIQTIDDALEEIEKTDENPELTEDLQNLISSLFSFSGDNEIAAIEGAVALAEFGQHEKALAEFQRLINNGTFPIIAAKNMLRCQFTSISPEKAVQQFKSWAAGNVFNKTDLKELKEFLKNMLITEGMSAKRPQTSDETNENGKRNSGMGNIFEIYSIRTNLEDDACVFHDMDFDITFQLGNIEK